MHATLFDALAYDLPAVDLRPRPLSCFDVCRAHLADGAIEAADANSISFLMPTGSVQVDIANGVDSVLLFALCDLADAHRDRVLSDEECAILVKAVVANQFQGRHPTAFNWAWNRLFIRRVAQNPAFDEIAFLASVSTPTALRGLIEGIRGELASMPRSPIIRPSVYCAGVPTWNPSLGVLHFGGESVRFRNQSGGVIRSLLDSFQSKSWPTRIATRFDYPQVRDAANTLRRKTAGWLTWHAEADSQVSWETV